MNRPELAGSYWLQPPDARPLSVCHGWRHLITIGDKNKPSNVLVTTHDFVYVVDFGIARSIGSARTSLTISGATIGTLDYMSPERFTRSEIDAANQGRAARRSAGLRTAVRELGERRLRAAIADRKCRRTRWLQHG